MNIPLQSLNLFVAQAIDAGIERYRRSLDPTADRIKQSEARRYLASQGLPPSMLQKWVQARLVKPVKTGATKNSAVWYSLADLKQAMATVTLKQINNENP